MISIIVPVYKVEPYLRKCVDSILAQKGDFDLELVIGEDCSTDNTHAICEEYVRRVNSEELIVNSNNSQNEPHALNDGKRVVKNERRRFASCKSRRLLSFLQRGERNEYRRYQNVHVADVHNGNDCSRMGRGRRDDT